MSTTSSSSNSLPIKHPTLRPRVFDPFSSHGPETVYVLDVPGAVAMYGPAARRSGRILLPTVDDDDRRFRRDFDEDTEHGGLDSLATDDAITDPARRGVIVPAHLDEDANNDDERCCGWACIKGLVALSALLGVIAVVLLVVLLSGNPAPLPPVANSEFQPSAAPTLDNRRSGDWMLVSEIDGPVPSFGYDVDFNSDGTVVAVSAPLAHGGRGQVEVFRWTDPTTKTSAIEDEEWKRVGDAIRGDSISDYASKGMDLSFDGSHLVVGYPGNDEGFVRVFRLENGSWVQQGQKIDGPSLRSQFGSSVAISKDGTYFVVGAPDAGDAEEGMFQAYKWSDDDDSSRWIEYGNARYGDKGGDRFGSSVAMSNNGDIIVVGAPGHEENLEDQGRVYYMTLVDPPCSSSADASDDADLPNGCWAETLDWRGESLLQDNGWLDNKDRPTPLGKEAGDRLGRTVSLQPEGKSFVSSSLSAGEQLKNYNSSQDDGVGRGNVAPFHVLSKKEITHANPAFHTGSIPGLRDGEGFGYNVALNHAAGEFVVAATSVNTKNQTGVIRTYKFDSEVLFRVMPEGSDIGSLPLGSGVWEGILKGTGPELYAGPSISMATPRLAVGYQSVLLDGEEVRGVVRIYRSLST